MIHLGHNDMQYHLTKNTKPTPPAEALTEIHAFLMAMGMLFPDAKVFFSGMFPRVSSWRLSIDEAKAYNRMAMRVGRDASHRGMRLIVTRNLWQGMASARAERRFYKADGLHLNFRGQREVAKKWLERCREM